LKRTVLAATRSRSFRKTPERVSSSVMGHDTMETV
jgi:hypothetical protein